MRNGRKAITIDRSLRKTPRNKDCASISRKNTGFDS
jgi:hypothetical protein